jgi:tRNA 2-selenouridine synthase
LKTDFIESNDLADLFLKKTPLIDVRAPIEFSLGTLPGAINLSILNDEERANIGTVFKKRGPEAALKLGHELVSGTLKEERIEHWLSFIGSHPDAVLFCFRGGQRSQITQSWLKERGVSRPIIRNGYKFARQYLTEQISLFTQTKQFLSLAGPTGSGKTLLLDEVSNFYPVIDLECLARHRGSAFGAQEIEQPSQIDFEHQLAFEIMKLSGENRPVLIEDESRLIGRSVLPKEFFEKLIQSPSVLIEESVEARTENIFQDYIMGSAIGRFETDKGLLVFQKYQKSLMAISKRLGGARTKEISDLLVQSEKDFLNSKNLEPNRAWIRRLLVDYYDPMYSIGLTKRKHLVTFSGSRSACREFLRAQP